MPARIIGQARCSRAGFDEVYLETKPCSAIQPRNTSSEVIARVKRPPFALAKLFADLPLQIAFACSNRLWKDGDVAFHWSEVLLHPVTTSIATRTQP